MHFSGQDVSIKRIAWMRDAGFVHDEYSHVRRAESSHSIAQSNPKDKFQKDTKEIGEYMNKRTANLLCILIGIIWGGGFIATDAALDTFTPLQMLLVRFGGAALLAWIPVWLHKDRITKEALKTGTVSGIFLYAAFALQTFGITMTDPGMNAFLTSVNVVIVPFLAWAVWKQKPDGIVLLAALVCTLGIAFLSFSSGTFAFGWGDILSLGCSFFFAAQIVSLGRSESISIWILNAVQLSVAALLAIPFGLPGQWPTAFSSSAVVSILYTIFLSTFLCYLLQTTAQKYTSCAAASILMGTESLWANVFSFLILHNVPSPAMITGGLLIFAAILLVEGRPYIEEKILPVLRRKSA